MTGIGIIVIILLYAILKAIDKNKNE